jgi:hypothetical protein
VSYVEESLDPSRARTGESGSRESLKGGFS